MRIDVEDELGYLEGISENLKVATKRYLQTRNMLEDYERKIRKHGYQNIIKQSNAQKMQLEFEHSVAQHDDNWKRWIGYKQAFEQAEIALEEAKADWELSLERMKTLNAVLHHPGRDKPHRMDVG